MRYALFIALDEPASEARPPAEIAAAMSAHAPYIEMLRRNRAYATSEALASSRTAHTVRRAGGRALVTEGPFAEGREQLGGFYVVDAPDLDEAIALASRCPALATTRDDVTAIEIRPLGAVGSVAAVDSHLGVGPDAYAGARWLLGIHRPEEDPDATDAHVARRAATMVPLASAGSATTLRRGSHAATLIDGPAGAWSCDLVGVCVVAARDLDDALRVAAEHADREDAVVEVRAVRDRPA